MSELICAWLVFLSALPFEVTLSNMVLRKRVTSLNGAVHSCCSQTQIIYALISCSSNSFCNLRAVLFYSREHAREEMKSSQSAPRT